jgi:hypothetical protein
VSRMNPSGSIKYIAEVKHKGRASRKTLGQYPILGVTDARREALAYIASVKADSLLTRLGNQVDIVGGHLNIL